MKDLLIEEDSKKEIFSNPNTKIYSVRTQSSTVDEDSEVILKVTEIESNESTIHRELSEKSPHIINYINSYKEEGKHYILMEKASQGSLADAISIRKKKVRYWSTRDTRNNMISILRAVKTMHKINIAHRDIKPDNIFVTADSEVKLGDFGLSQYAYSYSRSTKGTYNYLPPELKNGAAIDLFKSDAWSLGKTFLEMCALETDINVSDYFSDEEEFVGFLNRKLRDTNKDLRSLIKLMLRFDPVERISVTRALDVILNGNDSDNSTRGEPQIKDANSIFTVDEFIDFDL